MILIGTKIYGTTNKEFHIKALLGKGGFGDVFKVQDSSGFEMAIKTASVDGMSGTEYDQLVNEANLAATINHPNVISISYFHDGKEHPTLAPYILMELADGGSLKDFIDKRKDFFSNDELLKMSLQICEGMKAINEKLIHRDFHPGNVLIQKDVLKISDFGLSKLNDTITRTNTFKGIQHMYYKAPESWEMKKNSIQMDMYSVGIVLYQIATLKYPFELAGKKDTSIEVQEAHMFQAPTVPSKYNPGLSAHFIEVILKLMKKKPSDRYSNWDEAIQALHRDITPRPSTSINLDKLVSKVRTSDAQKEAFQNESNRLELEKQKINKLLTYHKELIQSDFQSLIEELKTQTDTVNLKIKKTVNGFTIHSNPHQFIICEFEIADQVSRSRESHFNGHLVNSMEDLKYKGKKVFFWGSISTSYGMGVNLILTKDEEDLYGNWEILTHSDNALSTTRRQINPFALKNWHEVAKQIAMINVLSFIDTTVKPYQISEVVFLLENIL